MEHGFKCKIIEYFKKKVMEENVWDLGLGKEFLDLTQKSIIHRKKLINYTSSKLKMSVL